MNRLKYFLATGLYSGYSPAAPGTVGSLILVLLIYIFPFWTFPQKLVLFFLLLFIGVWASNQVENDLGTDPQIVVIDEMAGQLLPLLVCERRLILFVLAFFLFRLFDIIKPFPVKRLERISGGWGIMLDDVCAGVYALGILLILKTWIIS